MIDKESLSEEWLNAKKAEYKKDPGLIESMIHALYLLEQLKLSGLDFIFKGGTSLILLLEKPARFSVDIDIIVNSALEQKKLENYLNKIIGDVFKRIDLDERRSYKGKVPKAHYKFVYLSNVSTKNKDGEVVQKPEREILLDILFTENPYPVLKEKPIDTEWLKQAGEPVTVKMPCENSITGDKLTAYAPNTIGVPYKAEKEKEIIKQLFDVGILFDLISDIEALRKSFHAISVNEINYREEQKLNIENVLWDVIKTGIIIAKRDKHEADEVEKFEELKKGINQFGHYVYSGSFRIEEAQVASSKAAYLAAHTLTKNDGELKKFREPVDINKILIAQPDYNFLNKKLKHVARGEALFYWSETVKLLYP